MKTVLDALLAPISRLCVARGVLFAEAAERLKAQFVRAAIGQIDGKVTDSRLSVMTGLQRRDIARLRAEPDNAQPPVNHLSRLVAQWVAQGGDAFTRKSFDSLAQEIRRDVHPATMLAQLRDAGTVAVTDEDMVELLARSYQPLPGTGAQLDYLARNGGDFLTAATANVMQDPAPFFERAVHYNQLSADAVAVLEAEYRAAQMQVLQQINAHAAALQATKPGHMRFRAGGYFYKEDEA